MYITRTAGVVFTVGHAHPQDDGSVDGQYPRQDCRPNGREDHGPGCYGYGAANAGATAATIVAVVVGLLLLIIIVIIILPTLPVIILGSVINGCDCKDDGYDEGC